LTLPKAPTRWVPRPCAFRKGGHDTAKSMGCFAIAPPWDAKEKQRFQDSLQTYVSVVPTLAKVRKGGAPSVVLISRNPKSGPPVSSRFSLLRKSRHFHIPSTFGNLSPAGVMVRTCILQYGRATLSRGPVMKQLVAVVLLISTFAFAKPKPATRTYSAPCPEVWEATKTVVEGHYDVLNLDDHKMAGSFTTGSIWSGVRPLAFSLINAESGCTVSVTGHYSGLIHNDKGDFFKRIQNAIDFQNARKVKPEGAPAAAYQVVMGGTGERRWVNSREDAIAFAKEMARAKNPTQVVEAATGNIIYDSSKVD
jgi:hypothetical protein